MINTAVVFFRVWENGNNEILPQDPSACFRARGFRFRGPQLSYRFRGSLPQRCFAEFAGLASQVRAGVLRRLFVWANLAGSFNHQQTVQAYMKHAKTEANLKKLIGGYRLRLLKLMWGREFFGGCPIHNRV